MSTRQYLSDRLHGRLPPFLDDKNIAAGVKLVGQVVGRHDLVQRLLQRHIDQIKGHRAVLDVLRCNEIQSGLLRKNLQDRLEARILKIPKQPRAIINSEVYGEGDIVKDTEAQVKKISEEGILFLYKNKEFLMKRSQLDRAGSGEGA
jgi:hypothetical protein